MQRPHYYIKSSELTEVETVIINCILNILRRREKLHEEIGKNIIDGKYKEVMDAAQELRFIDTYDGTLKHLKNELFEYASILTLEKIIGEIKFLPSTSYGSEFIITKDVMRKFSSYDEISQRDPKASIAKQLGAKIIA